MNLALLLAFGLSANPLHPQPPVPKPQQGTLVLHEDWESATINPAVWTT